MKSLRTATCAGLLPILAFTGCTVGPKYEKPDVSALTPATWKWQPASPKDAQPRGEWWRIFKDAELNRLEAMALGNNQEIRMAMARIDQARAAAGLSAAAYIPQLGVDARAQRERTSGNPPSPVPIAIPAAHINTFNVPLQLSYEIDLWGRVRRSIESANAQVDASVGDYHSVLLSLTGDVASQYFLIRSLDSQMAALQRTLASQEKTFGLIDQRFTAGTIPEADHARAKSEVATVRAEMADVKRQREETVNVLALLCGQPASQFSVSKAEIQGTPPKIPAGIPAEVLERRPDVAAAERLVAARNAEIGVEIAGYFPTVSLTGQAGYLSKDTSSLFNADSRVWSFGPSVSIPITGVFVTKAKVARARAVHEESTAKFRQSVLAAVKDVETSLIQIRYRKEQTVAQKEALDAALKATSLTRQLYEGGSISYLELLDAERTSLLRERQYALLKAQGHIATVGLIRALGGSW